MKTYKTAGVSKINGKFALRATNREGSTYSDILKKEGHLEVHLVNLPREMTKDEARKHLKGLKHFKENKEILAVLEVVTAETREATERVSKPKTAKAPKTPKAPRAPKKKDPPAGTVAADGSEVATAEGSGDDPVDVHQELGTPAFAKHVAEE